MSWIVSCSSGSCELSGSCDLSGSRSPGGSCGNSLVFLVSLVS